MDDFQIWFETIKHGKHNQIVHGNRYGSAPSIERARRLRKAGEFDKFVKRARERSGTQPARERPKPESPLQNTRKGIKRVASDLRQNKSLDNESLHFINNLLKNRRGIPGRYTMLTKGSQSTNRIADTNKWEKHGKKRLYFETKTDSRRPITKKLGYIDLLTGNVHNGYASDIADILDVISEQYEI